MCQKTQRNPWQIWWEKKTPARLILLVFAGVSRTNPSIPSFTVNSDGDRKSPHNPDRILTMYQIRFKEKWFFHWAPVSLACSLATYSTITKLKTSPFGIRSPDLDVTKPTWNLPKSRPTGLKRSSTLIIQTSRPTGCCDFFALKLSGNESFSRTCLQSFRVFLFSCVVQNWLHKWAGSEKDFKVSAPKSAHLWWYTPEN